MIATETITATIEKINPALGKRPKAAPVLLQLITRAYAASQCSGIHSSPTSSRVRTKTFDHWSSATTSPEIAARKR
jgi:hypothetical protein